MTTMIRKVWRSLTKPVFHVIMDKADNTSKDVIAGQTTQICTITIYLHADRKLGKHQREVKFPRLIIEEVPGVDISFGDKIQHGREALEIGVFVRATTCGRYCITPRFLEKKYNFKLNNITPVDFEVRPAQLHSLELFKIGSTRSQREMYLGSSVYRGCQTEIWLKAKDKFGNPTILDDEFKISSDSSKYVTLISTTPDIEFGNYLVTLLCNEVGRFSFDLLLSNTDMKLEVNDFEVLLPPVSPTNSYVVHTIEVNTSQEKSLKAGKVITSELFLYDIFGNQISCEESKGFFDGIRLVCCDVMTSTGFHSPHVFSTSTPTKETKKEEDSLKVCTAESDSNACVVKFTPLITGKRLLSLNVDGKEIKNSSIKLTVQPGPPHEVDILSQEPSSLSVYRSRTAKIWVTVKDEFGNQHTGSDVSFKVLSKGSFVTLLSFTYDPEKGGYVVIVRGDKTGKTSFDLIVSRHNREVVKCISLEVITPPVSGSNSYVLKVDKRQNSILKVGEAMELALMLHDIFGNKISCEESKGFLERLRLICCKVRASTCFLSPHVISTSTSTKKSKKEEDSLKVCPVESNSNACVVKFTPLVTGKRLFSLNVLGEDIKNSSIKLTVQPGPPHEVQILNREPSSLSIYRSRTAKIKVTVKDEFGNQLTGSDVSFKVHSKGSFVTLLFVTHYPESASYVVTVRGDKTGKTSFDLIVSQDNREVVKCISMEIITPPVSHSNCYIPQNDIETLQKTIHKSGKVITFQLKLIDIFGNPIAFEERGNFPENVRLVYLHDELPGWSSSDGNNRRKKTSLRVRRCEFDSCELGFTPLKAGKRWFFLEIAGEMLKNSKMRLAILPVEGQNVELDFEESYACGTSGDKVRTISFKQDNYIEFYEHHRNILCKGVSRRELVGADKANIKNINRVLEKEYPDCKLSNDMITRDYVRLVLFDLSNFPEAAALKVLELLSLLVGSEHCRSQANEMGDQREKWQEEEQQAILDENSREAKEFRVVKLECGRLMNENNEKASDFIFKFYNYGRPQSEIDLHGQRVANAERLRELRAKLLRENKTEAQVQEIIEKQRQKRDEAIRKLDERIRTFDHEKAKRDGEDWLEIIDGAGHHSATKGQQKIRPKVKEYLKKKNIKYVEANEGALLVTFSEYTGQQPCVGNFYCTKCKKGWTSISSWQGFYQLCNKCYAKGTESNCLPFKLRSTLPPKRQGGEFTRQDHRRLCEKCIQLKKDCRRKK